MSEKQVKNSFFSKEKKTCPVCSYTFSIEVLFSGRGRLNALDLLPDLRRTYRASKKFGEVFPLIYNPIVCPGCWYAALPDDFFSKKAYDYKALKETTKIRKQYGEKLVPGISFLVERDLKSGVLGFMLCLFSYTYLYDKSLSMIKKGITGIRMAWCLEDLSEKFPNEGYKEMAQLIRYFAFRCYLNYFDKFNNDLRNTTIASQFGPDVDHDYGTSGVMYLTAYLFNYFQSIFPPKDQLKRLTLYRRTLAKVFGLGRSSQDNPSPLLVHSRSLYDKLNDLIKNLEKELHAGELDDTDVIA